MHKVATAEAVEAIIGKVPPVVMLKVIDTLDEGCRSVLAHAPIAGLGFHDHEGVPHTTFVGGISGFTRVESPTALSFEIPAGSPRPVSGGNASMIFFLPGLGETLRLNGAVAEISGDRVAVDLHEAFIHCAKCVHRSGLWRDVPAERAHHGVEPPTRQDDQTRGPLSSPEVVDFLSSSSFLIVSSHDGDGHGDTSPKGDPAGFVRVIDGHTLAIPNRSGNRRADTLYNLTACDDLSLAALVPGREDALHVSGNAYVTDAPALLSTMALKGMAPHAALVVTVERAEIRVNEAVRTSRMWDPLAHVDRTRAPDLMKVAARHMAGNKERGALASITRVLSRGMMASPKLSGRAMDAIYRKTLKDEGY